jgi:hypothetical protein
MMAAYADRFQDRYRRRRERRADISANAGDATLSLTILNLTAASGAPRARIVLED